MDNKKVADLLEQLIHEIRQDGKITLSSVDNDKIVFAEGVIKELREGEDEEVRFTLPNCVVTDGTTGEQ